MTQPNLYSIMLAHSGAIGHINCGVEQYKKFASLRKPNGMDVVSVLEAGVPAVTNLSLGLELLVKVFCFQINGKYPRGHDISILGKKLPKVEIDNLRKIYKETLDSGIDQGLEFRFSSLPDEKRPEWKSIDMDTYDSAIEYVGDMYVKWRYIYEEYTEEVDINVSFAPLYFLGLTFSEAIKRNKGNTRITLNNS